MSDSPFPPADSSSPSVLVNADAGRHWGTLLMCIVYGVVVTLCWQCIAMFIEGSNARRWTWRWHGLLILYVFLIFAVSTIYTGAAMQYDVLLFIDFPFHTPGVKDTFYSVSCGCLVVSALLSDALMMLCHQIRRLTIVHNNIPADWELIVVALSLSIYLFCKSIA
ncbi:hypothetical protein EIP86_011455 [Pleurotus ostreatoroseus]|nr:hypothetical protein EIP86_011455 [Pleurotus ostreatoroseus]